MARQHLDRPSAASGPGEASHEGGTGGRPAVEAHPASGGQRVTTLHLPLIRATFTRPAHPARQVPAQEEASAGRPPAGAVPAVGVPLSRLAFYAGAVALGALEVVEWPVTLLVVAGTYLADHVRSPAAPGPAAPGPAGPGSAVPGPASGGSPVTAGVAVGGPAAPSSGAPDRSGA